jgi:hypothetical protein
VFWLARPPYARRVLTGLLVMFALWVQLRPDPRVAHPFFVRDLPAGHVLTDRDVTMREVPSGVLAPVEPEGTLAVPVRAGEPLIGAVIGDHAAIPAGWWALDVPVPPGVTPGTPVRLVVDAMTAPRMVPGVVVEVKAGDTFNPSVALVAVPEAEAAVTAAAVATATVAVLVGSDG